MGSNNDFSINIQIGLQDEGKQLLNQWENLKKKIQDDKLTINFGDSINESLKNISSISTQITNLSRQINNLNNDGKNVQLINTDNLKYEIKGALTSLEEVKKVIKDLGINNVLKIDIGGIDKTSQQITRFTVQLKEAEGIIKNLHFSSNSTGSGILGTLNVEGYEGAISKITDTTNKLLQQSAEQEVKNKEKIQQAISQTVSKREEENKSLEQNQAKAINKALEDEFKERQKIQESISQTIKIREQEEKILEQNQTKASNKVLEENYNNIQKFSSQSITQLDKLQEKFKGLYSNLEFSNIKNELSNLLPNDSELNAKFSNISSKIKELNAELSERQRVQNLGENIGNISNVGLNLNASSKEIENYIKTIENAKVQLNQIGEISEINGNKFRQFHYTVDLGNNQFQKYIGTINESDNSIRRLGNDIVDTSSKQLTFTQRLSEAFTAFTGFSVVMAGAYEAIHQVQEGIKSVVQMESDLATISVTMATNKQELKDLGIAAEEMAMKYGVAVDQVVNAMKVYANMSETTASIVKKSQADIVLASLSGMNTTDTTNLINMCDLVA